MNAESAAAYEEYQATGYLSDRADRLVDFAEVAEGARVLDVGCGTGIVARRVAPVVGESGRVTGVDINEHMLDVARRASVAIQPPIDWRCQDATSLDLPDDSFDVILSQQAHRFFRNRDAAVAEMGRVLSPDGRLAFSMFRSLDHNRPFATLADLLDRHVRTEAGDDLRSSYPDVDVEDLRALVEDAGFHDVPIRIEVLTVRPPSVAEIISAEAASSPHADAVASITQDDREALVQDLGDALSEYADDDGLALPIQTYMVSARH